MRVFLPHDVCRCAGHLCPDRETCARYVAMDCDEGRPVSQMATMRRRGEWSCDSYIPIKQEAGK